MGWVIPHRTLTTILIFSIELCASLLSSALSLSLIDQPAFVDTISYTIHVRVIQTNPSNWFSVVEKTNWQFANGGTWIECDVQHNLTMGGSGTSGMPRFKNEQGDYFLVALGVHNYKRWCDIVVDAKPSDTGVVINPTYYADGPGNRGEMLWKQLAHLEKKTSKGLNIKVDYYKEDGNTLYATTSF